MNILYLADPNSNHDIKWIEYMVSRNIGKVYLLPRKIHNTGAQISGVTLLSPIRDFSIIRLHHTIFTAFRMRKLIRKHKIDLIHILYAEPNSLWCLFRNYFSTPMVITCRGTDVLKTIPETFSKKSIINLAVAPAYKRAFLSADWVTGTSSLQLISINRFSGRDAKVSIIRTGVDLQRLDVDTSNHFPEEVDAPFIVFPRFIKPIYNHEFSLNAIAFLPEEIKVKYKMVFVGKDTGDSAYQQKIERMMNSMQDVHFIFLPKLEQEQIFELYKRASLVVMTPLSDGSPVSAMEALACGACVILGPLNYDKEIFNDNVSQLSSWNEHELAQLIIQSIKQERKKLTADWITKIDRNSEMKKVWDIYNLLVK